MNAGDCPNTNRYPNKTNDDDCLQWRLSPIKPNIKEKKNSQDDRHQMVTIENSALKSDTHTQYEPN